MVLAARALAAVLLLSTLAPADDAFTGWLKVELVNDAIWGRCELSTFVDEKGKGTQRICCRSDEGKPTIEVEEPLTAPDVAQLRQRLRDADLFHGQFWGSDLRGLDAPFVTLAVHDQSQAAIIVYSKNRSFETGGRRRLLVSLLARIETERTKTRLK